MKILNRYIIREHLGPFVLALTILTFLFLMNELIDILDMVIGKGLEVQIVLELLLYNVAWMLALTVPGAVLVSVLMSFGRLSADGEITALMNAPPIDHLKVQRLKKQKLVLKDEISRIEAEIYPDIIA